MQAGGTDYLAHAQAWYTTRFGEAAHQVEECAGFYGHAVLLGGDDGPGCVVKYAFQAGRAAHEVAGLERLRPHSRLPMPEVLLQARWQLGERELDVLVLERLPGVAPWKLAPAWPDARASARVLAAQLRQWHAQTHPAGFELSDGTFSPTLLPAFESWAEPLLVYLTADTSPFIPAQRQALRELWRLRQQLLAPINHAPSSLVHDDPHPGNFLFDEKSGLPCAALDPCDVAYRHWEQDVFHLPDVSPELGALEAYLELITPEPGFAARRWFFSLWDDVKHSRNLGWYDEDWFKRKLGAFADEYL